PSRFDPESLAAEIGWVRALAGSLVRDPARADDVSQQTLAAALEHPPQPGRPVRRWLAAIARNVVRQGLRGDARRAARETAAARPEITPPASALVERAAAQRAVVDAVLRLEEPYRSTVLLRFFEALPPREVAERQGVPVATVHTRLARAFEKLRADLDRAYGGRAAWAAWLLPLAPTAPVAAPAHPPAPASAVPIATGALVVNAKILVGGAVLAACAAAFLFWPASTARETLSAPEAPRVAAAADAPVPAVAAGVDAPERRDLETAASRSTAASAGAALRESVEAATADKRLHGRVIDLESRAVRGVDIRLGHGETPHELKSLVAAVQPVVGVSDDEGRFVIDAPAFGGELEVSSPHYVTVLAGDAKTPNASRDIVLVVAPKIALAGLVVDEAAAPIEGAVVELRVPEGFRGSFREVLDFSSQRSWHAKTDARGAFDLGDVPRVDRAEIGVSRAGFVAGTAPQPTASSWSLSIVLKRAAVAAPGEWVGRVVDASNRPVAGAHVTSGFNTTVADDAGRFSLTAERERRATLRAAKSGFQPASVAVSMDDAASEVVLRLGEAPLSIRGVVTRPNGKPAAEAKVWIDDATLFGYGDSRTMAAESVSSGSESMPIVQTTGDGRFVIEGLSSREYRVCAVDTKSLRRATIEGVRAGTQDLAIALPEGGLYERVSGRVVNRAGEPVAGVYVRSWRNGIVMGTPDGSMVCSS
ncbi:MAG TPA: sigma-70 family RNA polymerase sigma factor, partial [Planctomycetota bacterium]|nr:sigma-70 family RNA polymerase sigma factor [Planctomycetota bacterium]